MNDTSLGQFFTTNANHILQGFEHIVRGKAVLDPFAGQGDLLRWASRNSARSVYGLDIDPRLVVGNIGYNDSLKHIPHAEMIVTNPPFIHDGGGDAYLVALERIMDAGPDELVAIVPLSFVSYETGADIRRRLLTEYTLTRCNIFKSQVFDDTSINVVSFHAKRGGAATQTIEFHFFPNASIRSLALDERFHYRPGGADWAPILRASAKVQRVHDYSGPCVIFQCLDKVGARIHAKRASGCDFRKAERNWTAIAGDGNVELFNETIARLRDRYDSLCLPNYRDRYRKRLPFDWCYRLWNFVNAGS